MKKFLFIIVCGILSLMLQAQDSQPVLDKISQKLAMYQQVFPAEEIYFQTDKEIYAPGEIIWFGGIVFDRTTHQFSAFDPDIIVSLYDASGNFIIGDKFPVNNGKINGDLLLPVKLQLGRCYLAAYSPYQEDPDKIYIKPLMINRYYKSDVMVFLVDPDKVHQTGSGTDIELKTLDFNGNPMDKFSVNYEIRFQNQVLSEGKARSEAGKLVIQTILPSKTGKEPVELLVSHPKNLWSKKWTLKTNGDEIEVKFYAEGGHLLGTIPQKTGFYATSWNGTPIELEGNITNPSGQIISKVKTFSPGFGLFPIQAKPGEKCKLTITSEYGKGQSFELPEVSESAGVALLISKTDNDFITADLMVGNHKSQKLAVTATQGYHVLWATSLEIADNSRIKIPVKELNQGIVQLSVFDEQGMFQSSRLVFIPEKNKADLRITDVSSGEGKLKLTLRAMDENGQQTAAKVIFSVADSLREMGKPSSFKDDIVLNGELINVHSESGLLQDDISRKNLYVDYILICNEVKGFSWNKIMTVKEFKPGEFPAINTGISGKVTDKKGNLIPGAKINIMSTREMKMYTTVADDQGFFKFQELQPVNMLSLTISANDKNGKGNYKVVTDPTLSDKVAAKIKLLDYSYKDQMMSGTIPGRYLSSNPGQLFDQPVAKLQEAGTPKPRVEPYKVLLSTATNLLDVIKSMKTYTLINGQIVFSGMINSINAQSGALIVFDGVKMGTQADVLSNINPNDVDEIKISTDPIDIQRYTGLNNVGVIEITTKKGTMEPSSSEIASPREKLYKDGIRIPRNFLTTDALTGQSGKDQRTTLFWNPDLEIGSSGVTTFSIPLSEIKSGFVISTEGFTSSGKIIQARQVISVH
jgi:hypothetical protein